MSEVQVKRGRAEADRLVEEFEVSGLSRREWARRAGVSVHTLDFYRRQRGRVGKREAPRKPTSPAGPQWIEVRRQARKPWSA